MSVGRIKGIITACRALHMSQNKRKSNGYMNLNRRASCKFYLYEIEEPYKVQSLSVIDLWVYLGFAALRSIISHSTAAQKAAANAGGTCLHCAAKLLKGPKIQRGNLGEIEKDKSGGPEYDPADQTYVERQLGVIGASSGLG